jgi:DNA polymerase-3 subunit epsilon
MDLKARILGHLGREQMRVAVEILALPVTDRRRNDALRSALEAAPQATPRALLEALPLPELRQLCAAMGAPAARSRAATVDRLLGLTASAAPEVAVGRAASAAAVEPRRAASGRRSFAAIDFETADNGRDSACSVAVVRVEDGVVTARASHLIRPPRSGFLFTHIHGIRWADVRHAPTFGDLWPRLLPVLDGVDFLAAHNAPFDRSVLQTCCAAAAVRPPLIPFVCTVQVARNKWNIRPTKLPDVCGHLGIPLRHHDAASDAEACARIVLEAGADTEAGWRAYCG